MDEPTFCPRCGGSGTVRGLCVACLWASEPPSLEIPGIELEHELGSGGSGTVYRGRTSSGELVAVKVLDQDPGDLGAKARFERERALLGKLVHPKILQLLGSGQASGHLYLVTELALGGSLADRVPLQAQVALQVAIEVCDALAFAHSHGVVHRDIKPQNVLVAADGTIRLADFGAARQLDAEAARITATGQTAGTPYFVAPEILQGAPDDPRMDVYGVGVLLYHLITGALPIGYFAPLPGALDGALRRALAPIDQRYPTITALRDELARTRDTPSRPHRRRARWALPLGVAVTIAAAALFGARRSSPPTPAPAAGKAATRASLPSGRESAIEAATETETDPARHDAAIARLPAPPVVEPESAAAPVRPRTRPAPAAHSSAPRSRGSASPVRSSPPATEAATLTVIARPWAEVTIDGVPRGRAEPPLATFSVPPGEHDVVLSHPTTGGRWAQRIEVPQNGATVRADLERRQ